MDIRTGLDGLKTLLGVSATETPKPQPVKPAPVSVQSPHDSATFSSAAAGVAQSADADVRTDKVASIQAALAAGTYNVPASAVAGKLVDALLNGSAKG